jgi:hypothetical protein
MHCKGLADFIDEFEMGELTQQSFQTPSKPPQYVGLVFVFILITSLL